MGAYIHFTHDYAIGNEGLLIQRLQDKYNVSDTQLAQLLRQRRILTDGRSAADALMREEAVATTKASSATTTKAESNAPDGSHQVGQEGLICPLCRQAFGAMNDLLEHVPKCPKNPTAQKKKELANKKRLSLASPAKLPRLKEDELFIDEMPFP